RPWFFALAGPQGDQEDRSQAHSDHDPSVRSIGRSEVDRVVTSSIQVCGRSGARRDGRVPRPGLAVLSLSLAAGACSPNKRGEVTVDADTGSEIDARTCDPGMTAFDARVASYDFVVPMGCPGIDVQL